MPQHIHITRKNENFLFKKRILVASAAHRDSCARKLAQHLPQASADIEEKKTSNNTEHGWTNVLQQLNWSSTKQIEGQW